MKLLSPLDQMLARMETPRTPMHIGALAVFDLPAGAPRDFVRNLYEAFSKLEFLPFPFDSVIAGGPSRAYWKQVQPDPTYHVRLWALPYPGSGRDLGGLVERLHSTPLDMKKPLWEAHLIEGLENNQFAFYFKGHHCAVDGMGAVNFIKDWLSTDPQALPGTGRAAPLDEDYNLASVFALTRAKRTAEGVSAVGELVGRLAKMMRGANSTVKAGLKTPRTPFNARITRHRRLAVKVLDLPRVKAVAQSTESTVNNVILAAIGGACRRYLQEQDALPEDSLTASVAVGKDRDPGTPNAASGFVAPLGTTTEDPIQRLREISAVTDRGLVALVASSKTCTPSRRNCSAGTPPIGHAGPQRDLQPGPAGPYLDGDGCFP